MRGKLINPRQTHIPTKNRETWGERRTTFWATTLRHDTAEETTDTVLLRREAEASEAMAEGGREVEGEGRGERNEAECSENESEE